MDHDLAADVARVLTALHEAGAWFRHGLTDARIAELTGLTVARVVAARLSAAAEGLVERRQTGTGPPITLLTTLGVARTRPAHAVAAESEAKPDASD